VVWGSGWSWSGETRLTGTGASEDSNSVWSISPWS